MAIYALGPAVPQIHPDAFVHPEAVIIGDVTIGAESSVWPGAVIRGDQGGIVIGARTSVQDNSVIHTTDEFPTRVGDGVTIGHLVHLEGCVLASRCLVGSASVVLHDAHIGEGALVAANATVLGGTKVPPGALAVGTPAKIKLDAADPALIAEGIDHYVERARSYPRDLRRID